MAREKSRTRTVKLYYDPISTVSRPVMMFAAEHGIALEFEHVDLLTHQNREAAYAAINPNLVVPFLVDGDLSLGESSSILKYLADKVGSPAYPTELKARAKVNEALDWFATNFHEYYCVMAVYPHLGIPHGVTPQLAEHMIAFGEEHAPRWLNVLDRHMIGDRAFVCGDQISLADYLGASFVVLGEAVAFDLSPYPNIERWIARMKARPTWDATYAAFYGFLSAVQAQARIPA
ncbi:glutathione S-transferase family protein [Phenylobacterium hankyongense]|uniref:glutathione S-transferase family protein n=1 Tax=Phenylobacterium hankyongense TaxID=1813876 RepID=UPI00140406DB|nr:glutathione S-transferase family protein [Phenylobacterium hankyongense]